MGIPVGVGVLPPPSSVLLPLVGLAGKIVTLLKEKT
eukprot:SAG22_NODE_10676_length_521_cov_1.208531_1_plen_35_part_10